MLTETMGLLKLGKYQGKEGSLYKTKLILVDFLVTSKFQFACHESDLCINSVYHFSLEMEKIYYLTLLVILNNCHLK